MPKRTLAALCALLAFMAVLAVVPLATAEPAEAHTKTVRRCMFDPLSAQQQCWNEKGLFAIFWDDGGLRVLG